MNKKPVSIALFVAFTLLIGLILAPQTLAISGGNITTDGAYTIHTFYTNGSFNMNETSITASILVIAGGGSGGSGYGAGGGAGEYNYTSSITLTTGNYTIIVGSGGIAGSGTALGTNGTNSSFGTIINTIGGSQGSTNDFLGACRVSCGGGYTGYATISPTIAGHGYASGSAALSTAPGYPTGSGGGCAGAGFDNINNQYGGNGGQGCNNSITGASVCYAGGGAGNSRTAAKGGNATCGGGNGGAASQGSNATANTGAGGGGSGNVNSGGNGGSGIVIIRYSPSVATISFNANTTAAATYYNETQNNIYASVKTENFPGHNSTTIYLYNTSGLYTEHTHTSALNFSQNFTNLPTATYYLNASASNGSSTIKTSTSTITIYGLNTNITSPSNNTAITRNINLSYNTSINPSGAVIISNNNITLLNSDGSLNFTINSSTNTTPYIYDTFQKNFSTGIYKINVEAKDSLGNTDNYTTNINITRNALLNITAKYIFDNTTISNFTINITDETTNTTETFNTTSNQTSFSIIKNRNYTIVIDAPGYALNNVTHKSFNQTFNNYSFLLYTSNSVQIYIYDETTGIIITENISITFTQGLTEITNSTITGSYYQDGLTEGSWDIKFIGGNYTLKTYTISVANRSTQTLNAYLTTSDQTTIFTIMDFDTGVVLPGASVTQSRLINGSYTIVNVKTSDITGRAQLVYVIAAKYQFIVTLSGYDTNIFYLDPVLFSTYNIRMTRTTTLTPESTPDYTSIDINFYNNLTGDTTWLFNRTNTLIWIISSPIGSLDNYNLTLTYPGGSSNDTGNLATGEQFTIPFNITSANSSSRIIIDYCYKSTTSYQKCFRFPYSIIGAYDNTSMIANKGNNYGLSVLERVMIVTMIVIAIGGFFFMVGGLLPGLLVSVLIMSFFVGIGFTSLWMNLPSLFIGIVILMRGDKT